jgi:membrane protease YdiL (CAAX protease family)
MAGWDNRGENIPAAGPTEKQFNTDLNAIAPRGRSPLKFFVFVFALSIPFWLIGALTGLQLLPGLPVSSLMVFCPLVAASILVYKENKTAAVIELLKRSFDYRRIKSKIWYVPIVLLVPGVTVLSYSLMRLARMPLSIPQFRVQTAVLMFLAFFVAALTEELGWMGYAIDPIQRRWNALQAGILLGLVWAAWHILPLVQAHRSPVWIAWWCLDTVATRVLIVWIYNNTGHSLFAAILYHAIGNVSTLLFPSYFDPRITGSIVAAAAAIVTIIWGPRTLSRDRNA